MSTENLLNDKPNAIPALAQAACSALGVEEMIIRLATRGLVPCEHNLQIWQCADGDQWGAAVSTPYTKYDVEVTASSLAGALVELIRKTNSGADVEPNRVIGTNSVHDEHTKSGTKPN